MSKIASFAMPAFAAIIVLCGIIKDLKVFDLFTQGAFDGIKTAVKLLPVLLATVTAVQMLSASGMLDVLSSLLSPVAKLLGLPGEVIPIAVIHPFSSSGANALLISIFEKYGPDSYIGLLASVICASSETTFYSFAVYFGSASIKKTRFTLVVALLGNIVAAIASGAAVRLFM